MTCPYFIYYLEFSQYFFNILMAGKATRLAILKTKGALY